MTTTQTAQTLLLDSYTVTAGEPTVRNHAITGEYIIAGKRGATYRTYRRFGKSSTQFVTASGRFVALAGNHTLHIDQIKIHAPR